MRKAHVWTGPFCNWFKANKDSIPPDLPIALGGGMAYPAVKQIFDGARPSGKKSYAALERFVSKQTLLRHHAITRDELKMQIFGLRAVSHARHFIFLRNAIRTDRRERCDG